MLTVPAAGATEARVTFSVSPSTSSSLPRTAWSAGPELPRIVAVSSPAVGASLTQVRSMVTWPVAPASSLSSTV